VSDTVRELLTRESKNLIGSAELMPADKYGYHPTPQQMTFGQLIVADHYSTAASYLRLNGILPPTAQPRK
jgi:hypothetical protein